MADKQEKTSFNGNGNLEVKKLPGVGKVKPVTIVDEMKKSYLDYAMSVIVSRALPDVRDGLKPVQRRILYAMQKMGVTHSARYTKSAKIVGECFVKDSLVLTEGGLVPIQDIQTGI